MFVEILKSIALGVVEGITEWLPISSTGHMILVNKFMGTGSGFLNSQLFLYVIQLGAILAIVTIYFKKLNPFALSKTKEEKKDTFSMWIKVAIACLPAVVAGLLFNDFMDSISTPVMVASTLIIYGIAFIFVEKKNKQPKINSMNDLTYKTAFLIGVFQVLSIVPGTSRSGATILGAILLGASRGLAAEFSFFLAIPVMFGASFLKIITNTYPMIPNDWILLIIAMVVSYIVSLLSVNFLIKYVREHDFKPFGIYRIVLGVVVILAAVSGFLPM